MNRNRFLVLIIPALAIIAIILAAWKKQNTIPSEAKGFALIELFTSEGCSSCPAADAALSRIAADYKKNVYVLGFHVDYWNRLGWKDVFSDAAYSERQRQYSTTSKGDGVYTPQVIINGTQHLVGSNEIKIRQYVDELLKTTNSNPIELSVTENGNTVHASYRFENKNDLLNIALVQLHSETIVKAGENGGRTLKHINIVRDFKTVSAPQGSVVLQLPPSLKANDFFVIAYSQNKKNQTITGASQVNSAN